MKRSIAPAAARAVASVAMAVAVASPLHDAGGCVIPYMTGSAGGTETVPLQVSSVAMWCAMVVAGWATWTRRVATHRGAVGAALAVAVAAWWAGATELNRELCTASTPGLGVWLGWVGLAVSAWTLAGGAAAT